MNPTALRHQTILKRYKSKTSTKDEREVDLGRNHTPVEGKGVSEKRKDKKE